MKLTKQTLPIALSSIAISALVLTDCCATEIGIR